MADLEPIVAGGRALTREQLGRVVACRDLPALGLLGELARKAKHANRVTFVRVAEVPAAASEAGEIRLTAIPESLEQAEQQVREAVGASGGVPVTAYSLADLWRLAGATRATLSELATRLRQAGLSSIAEVAVDEVPETRAGVEMLQVLQDAGLPAWRATVRRAAFSERPALIDRAAAIQRETGAFKAFAPLPRLDPVDQPSTGYDDVRTVALARLVCTEIPTIQVDWALYGPKLAQVAIAFGADDLDGVPATSQSELGRRRSTRADIERQVRMAFGEPAERDGRFEIRG